ncbi:endonuclease domain-containing protein [Algoriphagus boritolerans]|uniref:endonuclease domain-containing protein n=1 Tax=Algoriphagus boritolerans TaxID=308111 RepID=UPI000AAB13F6
MLRKSLTPAERILWDVLKNRQMEGYKFRRQHPINRYIADFYCHELRLVIELDGGVHNKVDQREHDSNRDIIIREFGIQILRFKNEEVMNDPKNVVEKVKAFLH